MIELEIKGLEVAQAQLKDVVKASDDMISLIQGKFELSWTIRAIPEVAEFYMPDGTVAIYMDGIPVNPLFSR